jgi:ABC-type glycerol-3-phosphate transport system substrate-binding protein
MNRALVLALVALSTTVASAEAEDAKLPATLTFTASDTGSSGFNIAVAVGKAFKQRHGTDLRVLPAGNDVARLAPVKARRAQVAANGTGT